MMRTQIHRPRAALVVVLLAAAPSIFAQQTPGQRPSFRSGVELVSIDVSVFDNRGEPVRGLSPADFTVTVEGQRRKVVSADLIDVGASKAERSAKPELATISTNTGADAGRQVIFAVDQGTLDTTNARHVAKATEHFFSQLSFADRSGVVLLPVGANVSLTWAHDQVRAALQRASGLTSPAFQWDAGTLTEARDISNRSVAALQTVGARECGNTASSTGAASGASGRGGGGSVTGGSSSSLGVPVTNPCLRNVQLGAETAWRLVHATSMSSVTALRQILDTLRRVRGDKVLILISGGWPMEPHDELSTVHPVAALATQARVTIIPIYVPREEFSASRRSVNVAPSQDQALQWGPLQVLANLTGGEFLRADVNPELVFDRIGREMSAYYRVGVEREAGDETGDPRKLSINVARPGTTVRARKIFDVRTFEDRNWPARLASALDSPVPADGIPLQVTSYVSPNPENPTQLNVMLSGEATRIEPGDATLQVVVRDAQGRKVLAGEPPVTQATEHGLQFGINVPVPPGSYIVRIGVLDSAGLVGSVEHRVDARRQAIGSIEATGPVLVRVPSGSAQTPRLALGPVMQGDRLALEIALQGAEDRVAKSEVVFEIAAAADGPALIQSPATVSAAAFEGAYMAQAVADLRLVPPGRYVARARVRSGGGDVGSLDRWFVVEGAASTAPVNGHAAPSAAPSGAAPPSARIIGAVRPFALEDVIAPAVVNRFLDRVAARKDAASPMIGELVQRARAEGIDKVPVSDTLAAEYPVAAFLRGLKQFNALQFEAAAASFRAAMRGSNDMFPAMVYLGACYAAGGKDKEAAGAWQNALVSMSDAIDLHRLLADALLRQGSTERALQTVERAQTQWPDDPELQQQFVVAALAADKRLEGLKALDTLIEKKSGFDEPTLTLAILVLYEASERSRPIESVEADRARMVRLSELYRSRGGPSLALVEAWMAAVNAKR